MKKTLATLITAAIALASVSAFAQDAASGSEMAAPAKKDHSKPKHQLKHHGSKKGQAKAAAASAAGTNDAGAQN
ncbi:hypothetical protein NTJ56_01225 [Burkholderia contaminans]|uniref:hypothetical protein n=1 Tax=Burkholderia contaminans TaxID=488447 RepID=UPI001CF47BA6|nr:hypothetical protein [Burkholderia contaminans]MCA7920446.1 hypothetical protein [Burkholderia contaminans]MCA8102576.1 hypothetical protein [Burkholderia contaminans]UUX37481.1 hypothetical protein NTJ56_01225 [Burkholderia contaminans]